MIKSKLVKSLAYICVAAQLVCVGGSFANTPKKQFTVQATEQSSQAGFDENDVVLTFGALSDVHIGYGTNTRLFHQALSYYEKNYDLDGLFISGDLTQSGTLGEATEFIRIIEEHYDPAQTPVMACYGNHDTFMFTDLYLDEFGFYDAFYAENSDLYNFDVGSLDQIKAGNRWTQVEGADGKKYNFVCAELSTYGGANTKLSEDTIAWLDQTLNTITTENPNQYVFVAIHSPAEDTVAGSYTVQGNMPGCAQYETVLGKYPQAVLFTGHTHFPMQDDLSINQGTYTQVHIGAESDVDLPAAVSNDRHAYSVGQVVEIDGDGYVRITRLDFMKKQKIREPWELLPCGSEGYLSTYNFAAREAANTDPFFADDAEISVKELQNGNVMLTFDRAIDDMMIFSYEITVTDTSGNAIPVTLSDEKERITYQADNYYKGMVDDFYDWADPAEMPAQKSVLLKFVSRPAYPYTVSVVAYDAFGAYTPYGSDSKGSAPLTLEVTDAADANTQKAAAFNSAVSALGEASALTEESKAEIQRLRQEYATFDYKTKALATKYADFAALESYFYNNIHQRWWDGETMTAAMTDSYLAATYKGSLTENEKGVTLKWTSASANSLIGTKHRYSLDGITLSFENLAYQSTEKRTFALVVTGVRGDKWTDSESALVWLDMETGRVYFGDIYLGQSDCCKADVIGGSPFDIRLGMAENGAFWLSVDTVYGSSDFEIPSRFVEEMENLYGYEYAYIYCTPWSARQTMQVDLVSVR